MSPEAEQFWREAEPSIRNTLHLKGHTDRVIDEIVAGVKRRCADMPMVLHLDIPKRVDRRSRESILQQAAERYFEITGFFIAELISAEIDIAYPNGNAPNERTALN